MALPNDPWGDKEIEQQRWESPEATNYRHWQEKCERDKKQGYKENPYKPLDDWWQEDRDEYNYD